MYCCASEELSAYTCGSVYLRIGERFARDLDSIAVDLLSCRVRLFYQGASLVVERLKTSHRAKRSGSEDLSGKNWCSQDQKGPRSWEHGIERALTECTNGRQIVRCVYIDGGVENARRYISDVTPRCRVVESTHIPRHISFAQRMDHETPWFHLIRVFIDRRY